VSPHQSHRHYADTVLTMQQVNRQNAEKVIPFSSERSGLLRTIGAPMLELPAISR
jgi:hypothetical protein